MPLEVLMFCFRSARGPLLLQFKTGSREQVVVEGSFHFLEQGNEFSHIAEKSGEESASFRAVTPCKSQRKLSAQTNFYTAQLPYTIAQ